MSEDWTGAQQSQMRGDLQESITQIGLRFRLMTQFTSFVAVEESTVTQGGVPTKVEVPVELPHGVSYDGIFGGGGGVAVEAEAKVAFRARASVGGFITGSRHAMPSAMPAPPMAPPPSVRSMEAPRQERLARDSKEVSAKLDPQLRAFAAGTPVEVKVWLTDDSPAVIARLAQLGLSVTRHATGKIVYGRIDGGALAALAGLDAVLFVSKDIGQP